MLVIILVVGIIAIPIANYGTNRFIAEFHSIKTTVENARIKGESFKNITKQLKIIEINKELAMRQYTNTTILDDWVPDKIMDLKPIK